MAISKTKKKKERKKINDDMTLMWFNWSVATINVMLQLLDIYIYIYICRVLICGPNPKYMGSQPSEPNTINL